MKTQPSQKDKVINYWSWRLQIQLSFKNVQQKEPSKPYFIKILSMSHCLWMTHKTFVSQTLTLYIRLTFPWRLCEMKISPAISINKKCHSHQRFLASKCERELPKLGSVHTAPSQGDCWGAGGMQEARWTGKQVMQMKGMNSVSPEACIFQKREC